MNLDEISARLSIMDLTARYTRAGDTGRAADLASLFAPDGVFEVSGGRAVGPTEIVALIEVVKQDFATAPPAFYPARHTVSGLVIDMVDESNATGRSYFVLVAGWGVDHWGVYRDEYRRFGDRWLFSSRRGILEGTVEQSPVRFRLERPPTN
jgi:SnoaL-like domain